MKSKFIAAIALLISSITSMACSGCSCHGHVFTIRKYDETHHWFECECGERAYVEEHDLKYSGNNTEHWKVCSCGYEGEKEGHHLVHQHDDVNHYDICNECQHKFDIEPHDYTDYDYDETHHWLKCECGQPSITKKKHTFDKKVVDLKYLAEEANESHPNVYYYSCICGAKGTETFVSGLPLNHEHEYDYKGYCTSEYCDDCVQQDLEFYDTGSFNKVGEMVFKLYIPIVGKINLIADFTALNGNPVVIYKENGDQMIKYYASGQFTNDKAQTVYVHVKPAVKQGYIVFTCAHQVDYTGECTQCHDYNICNNIVLGEETKVQVLDLLPTYFSFTAPYSGLFEITSKSEVDGSSARYEDFKNSDGTSADYAFGKLSAIKDQTYYFIVFANGSTQRETYTFSAREVRDEVTAVINSVTTTKVGDVEYADLSITILEGQITSGQIINIISNSGKTNSYIVDDVETDSFVINYHVISASTVNNHITIKNSSLTASDKNSLITDKDEDEYVDTLYFNFRMYSASEIGDNITLLNGARVMMDVFNNQTFVPVGTFTTFYSPSVENGLCPNEGAGIEIAFAYSIPGNLFKKETIYNILLRNGGLFTLGECALVDSKDIAQTIRYHDEVKYYSDKAKNGYIQLVTRYWAATVGNAEKYYSTITLSDTGSFYESTYIRFKYFLEIVDMVDTPNGLKLTYSIFFRSWLEDFDIEEVDYLWLIDEEGGLNSFPVYEAGEGYFILEHLTTSESILNVVVGFAY